MPKETFFNLNDEKRERIIRSAISEFNKNGFEKGNVGDIAKGAEVAKGSMYQYFESKKELFLYCITWALETLIHKYGYEKIPEDINIFDYFYKSAHQLLIQLKEERELAIFMQDLVIGKHNGITDETSSIIMRAADEYMIKLIKDGKKNKSIRDDIDDRMLFLFSFGASLKIKEDILDRIKNSGKNFVDEDIKFFEDDIKSMIELLKNGMGATLCL